MQSEKFHLMVALGARGLYTHFSHISVQSLHLEIPPKHSTCLDQLANSTRGHLYSTQMKLKTRRAVGHSECGQVYNRAGDVLVGVNEDRMTLI